ncbi:MAG: 2-oxoacid:acceptor oxidoreductase family protein [Opitutales bacterium]|nr:2-oxoacid:acceptor oxidoreductase family protein [Opitutales bacterium]
MKIEDKTVNVKIAGLGGMGVLKAALILGELMFEEGFDVKKAEVHGMSQRGGSVASDVRFGREVLSPIIPEKSIDILLSLEPEWSDVHKESLAPGGIVISPSDIDGSKLPTQKALNVALLGVLSRHFDIPEERWLAVLDKFFPEKLRKSNLEAFKLGRNS